MFQSFLQTFSLSILDAQMIGVGIALFFVFWQTLKYTLFLKYIEFYEARETALGAATSGAGEVRKKAHTLTEEYEAALLSVRVASLKKKIAEIEAAKAQASAALATAKTEAQEKLKSERLETKKEIERIRATAGAQADSLSRDIVQRLTQGLLATK